MHKSLSCVCVCFEDLIITILITTPPPLIWSCDLLNFAIVHVKLHHFLSHDAWTKILRTKKQMMHILDYFMVAKCGRYLVKMHIQWWWLFNMATSCSYYHYFGIKLVGLMFPSDVRSDLLLCHNRATCFMDSSKVVIYITNSKGCLDDVSLPNWTPTR